MVRANRDKSVDEFLLEGSPARPSKEDLLLRNPPNALFRVWIIFAVLWVGAVAIVSGPGVYREFDELAEMKTATEKRRNAKPWLTLSHEEFLAVLPGIRLAAPSPRRSLLRVLAVALVPPLALLAIASTLLW